MASNKRSLVPALPVLMALVLAVIGPAACRRLGPPPMPPLAAVSAEPDGLPPVDLYVDDSSSMRGYLGLPGSRYRQVAVTCLEKLTTAGYDYSVIRFSDLGQQRAKPLTRTTPTDPTDHAMFTTGYYASRDTPLATLLDRVSELNRAGRLVVVLTDLVHSDRERSSQQFLESVRRAASARSDIMLLGFRSAFRGTYFVETRPRHDDAFEIDLDGTRPDHARPFYLIVLAPFRRGLDDFRKYVISHLSPEAEFHASERPMEFDPTGVDLLPNGPFGRYRKPDPLPGQQSSVGFIGTYHERQRPRGEQAELGLRLTGRARLPLRAPEDVVFDVARLRGKNSQWEPVKAELNARWRTAAPASLPGRAELTIRYQVPRVQPYTWDVYRVRVKAGRANLSAPAWVEEWNIRDDRLPQDGTKDTQKSTSAAYLAATRYIGIRTLNLALVVEALLRGVTEEVVFSEHYLRLGRED